MERHRKCKKVARIIDCKTYRKKIVCQTQIDVNPINTAEVSIIPTVNRYFYVPTSTINLVNGVTLPANLFYNDDGKRAAEFMSLSPNGYANLYINAVIQEGGMYAVSTDTLRISPSNSRIFAGTPIIVELLTFSAKLVL